MLGEGRGGEGGGGGGVYLALPLIHSLCTLLVFFQDFARGGKQ